MPALRPVHFPPVSRVTVVSNKKDALPKKHLPPISTSSSFGGIFTAHISPDSSITTQYPILTNIGGRSCFLVNSITSDFEADIVRPAVEKETFNDVQAAIKIKLNK
jgi:hypothetical protein